MKGSIVELNLVVDGETNEVDELHRHLECYIDVQVKIVLDGVEYSIDVLAIEMIEKLRGVY